MSLSRVRRKAIRVALCIAFASSPVPAQSPDKARAAEHFSRGVASMERDDLVSAVAEFEAAYRERPHYSVLFNLGQAYGMLGKPVESIDTLSKYLADGGGAVDASRRTRVTELIATQERRIGKLELQVDPPGAEVLVDGSPVGQSPLASAVRLPAGIHGVVVRRSGSVTWSDSVTVHAMKTAPVTIRLQPATISVDASGQLALACERPGVTVRVDGVVLGKTPLFAPLVIASGPHVVHLEREGYVSRETTVNVVASGSSRLSCDLAVVPADNTFARLALNLEPSDAEVHVDGLAYGDAPLPRGVHAVQVGRTGYVAWRGTTALLPASTQYLNVVLAPTEPRRAALRRSRKRRQVLSVALGAGGVALAGGAAAVFAWNADRYETWQLDRAALDQKLASEPADAAALEQNRNLQDQALGIQRADGVALGLVGAGVGALITAAILWFTGDPEPATTTRAWEGREP